MCLLPFGRRSAHFFFTLKNSAKASLTLNSSFLDFLLRVTKTYSKATQCCLLMPGYTAQTPMELQSGLEQLHTKMFSCVNASHALGGLSAGGSVFPPPH